MITISNFGNTIKINRDGVTREYDSFLPTAGQNRLYDFLKANADKFDVQPYRETNLGVTLIATISKTWTLKS